MEKARKETESTRCPRPGLIPAVLQGISSRETFLAIGSRSRGAAGFPFFCVFFPPFHPIRPCGAELPAVGRQRKVMKAMSEESKCLKLVFFAQNRTFLIAQSTAGPRSSSEYQPGSSDSTRPHERWGQNLFSPSLGHQNPDVTGSRREARSQKPRAKKRGPSGLQIDCVFPLFPIFFCRHLSQNKEQRAPCFCPSPRPRCCLTAVPSSSHS